MDSLAMLFGSAFQRSCYLDEALLGMRAVLRAGQIRVSCFTLGVSCVLIIHTTLKTEGEASCCSATQPTGWATLLIEESTRANRVYETGPAGYLRPRHPTTFSKRQVFAQTVFLGEVDDFGGHRHVLDGQADGFEEGHVFGDGAAGLAAGDDVA